MRHHDALHKIHQAQTSGQTRLDLTSMDLEDLPPELAGLERVETLDLSGNRLEKIPSPLFHLPRLKRLFLTKNRFSRWPENLHELKNLELLSLKSNALEDIPSKASLPSSLVWLILTDNRIPALPGDFGHRLPRLRKLALAGNRLSALPESFGALKSLELLRLGMNRLEHFPLELRSLKALTWVGLGGNPWEQKNPRAQGAAGLLEALRLPAQDIRLGGILGSGASGVVYAGESRRTPGQALAVKVFKAVSSDGHPDDELAVAAAAARGDAPAGIIPFRGWYQGESKAMVMDFIPQASPLGQVPSLESVTRDTYPSGLVLPADQVRNIALTMARVQTHLTGCGIIHGDFYAHNILVSGPDKCLLGDWGASFFFPEEAPWGEKWEVRAYGCLLEELLNLCPEPPPGLERWKVRCLEEEPSRRPDFREIAEGLI